MKSLACPGGCGHELDYDNVPSYSQARAMSGKFCPYCGFPLDEATAKADTLDYGPESGKITASRMERAAKFHKASAKPVTTPA